MGIATDDRKDLTDARQEIAAVREKVRRLEDEVFSRLQERIQHVQMAVGGLRDWSALLDELKALRGRP
jgi:predicted nuclease with TOPRIM domain